MKAQSTRKRIDIDFERVSNVCALVRLTKTENVYFRPGDFSHAIFRVKFNVASSGSEFFYIVFQ